MRPLIGLPGSVWIPTGCGAAAVVLNISLGSARRSVGEKRASRSEWVSACWIKNLVSSCVDRMLTANYLRVKLETPSAPCLAVRASLVSKAKLDNVVSCWSSLRSSREPWNARHPIIAAIFTNAALELRRRPFRLLYIHPVHQSLEVFLPSESTVRWNWADCHDTLRAWECFDYFKNGTLWRQAEVCSEKPRKSKTTFTT